MMLQRTSADQVLPVYEKFARKYPFPDDYASDPRADVFETLGLVWREKNLKALADILGTDPIPVEKDELLNLPGIGPYIAAAFRSLHLNLPDTIIDSNVVRVYGRFFGFQTDPETRRKKWFIEFAEKLTPLKTHRDYNYALIDFTRAVCKPRPACEICPLEQKCHYALSENRTTN
ncbi:hypothetical protein [Domibacillus enclensis]|uniref:A/G-specific DNA-adenine glycosylase n=1 Tax=Domibacillus enclensis TaxID=1017273 RepID=A0A1N7C4P7_9BACI|nr:hypothetical protein [Domibacillus enclensis]OXS74239.1 hypothetical protein B1B05_17355 [Domibacillus enclensis]SIR58558.1 A/G-specific DNA-adenine glycosylase [Domibacillus enclensis]